MSKRQLNLRLTLALLVLFASAGARAAVFPVTPGATQDEPDIAPGNGQCLTASAVCTLRAAVQEANAFAGSDRIEVPAGIYTLTLTGADDDVAASGDLDLLETLDILGVGAGAKIVDANGLDRVFDVHNGVSAAIEGITIRGGSATTATPPGHLGGGLLARAGANVDLTGCQLLDNHANAGGALFAQSGATVTVTSSSLRKNSVAALGFVTAEGSAVSSEGDIDLDQSEVTDNSSAVAAGAVFARGGVSLGVTNTTISGNQDNGLRAENTELDVVNSTLAGNSGFGLSVFSDTGNTLSVRNSILADSGGFDCSIVGIAPGDLDFPGEHNLSSDGSCPHDGGVVDLPNTDPQLGLLLPAGAGLLAHVPLIGSPVIDSGNDDRCEPGDQRGATRPLDGDGAGLPAAVCDIGAVEVLPCVGEADGVVSGEMIDGPSEFEACFTLGIGPAVDVLAGGDLTLRARNQVSFGNGVSVLGGTMTVVLDPAAGSGIDLP
jgi:hypothetical protein